MCLIGGTYTDYDTALAAKELLATSSTVLCSVPLSSRFYQKAGNFAAPRFHPYLCRCRTGMVIMMIKVAFYDAKEYDKPSFEQYGSQHDIRFRFLETKLNEDTVDLAKGCEAVCVFVNDTVNAAVIDKLYQHGVKIVALRSAGYNNVDVQAAFGKIHVVHVPAYSPYAVAEHAIALLLTSVRRIHKAYNRTREFNFSLNGLTGFDFHGKTVGVIGTGKIGRIFIDICRGFGMNVIAYDLFQPRTAGFSTSRWTSFLSGATSFPCTAR